MLNQLAMTDFKCFRKLSLPLSNLTLLTGYNAAGKSTALQALLLPAQGVRQRYWRSALYANGPLVQLGTGRELLRQGALGKTFSVTLSHSSGESLTWVLDPTDDDVGRLSAKTSLITASSDAPITSTAELLTASSDLVPYLRNVMYISAERLLQDDFHPAPKVHARKAAPDVGVRGEFAAWHLHRNGDDDVASDRFCPGESSPVLRKQLNAWASYLFGFAEFNAQRPTLSTKIWLEIRTSETGNWKRAANLGYGLSYAFPVLLGGLLARRGQAVVVDSPEAHLHPLAQSRMGYFLACMSRAGVQVLVETHSDHLVNGVRLAIKEGKALPEQISIHFFGSRAGEANDAAHVTTPLLGMGGGISHWPVGFFDQAERDLSQLAGW